MMPCSVSAAAANKTMSSFMGSPIPQPNRSASKQCIGRKALQRLQQWPYGFHHGCVLLVLFARSVRNIVGKSLTFPDVGLTFADKTRTPMTALIRAAALQGYDAAARSVGLSVPGAVAHGMHSATVACRNRRVSFRTRLLSVCWKALRCSGTAQTSVCGLHNTRKSHLEGPLTLLMRHAPTLNDALATGAQYGYVFSPCHACLTGAGSRSLRTWSM